MPTPPGWAAAVAIGKCRQLAPWSGLTWRAHKRQFLATDYTGSILFSGRYNRGYDAFPRTQVRFVGQRVWQVLYLALGRDVAIGEVLRHIDELSELDDYRFTELQLDLDLVIDCRDASAMGLTHADQTDLTDWEVPREIAKAAIAGGA